MGWRKAFFKQQAHWIALVAERRLNADEHIAEALAQHKDGRTIALLTTGCGAPLALDFRQPALALDVVIQGNACVDIGMGTKLLRIARDDHVAQIIHSCRHGDGVPSLFHGCQCVEQGSENRQVSRRACVAGIGWKVEQNNANLALCTLNAAQLNQLINAGCKHFRTVDTHVHGAGDIIRLKGTAPLAARARRTACVCPATKYDRARCAIQLRDGHHDRALDRQKTTVRRAPLLQGLKLDRVRCYVGDIKPGEHFLGCFSVVVGGSTNQRKPGQGHKCID